MIAVVAIAVVMGAQGAGTAPGEVRVACAPDGGAIASEASPYDDGAAGDGEVETTRVAPDGESTRWTVRDGVLVEEDISTPSAGSRLTRTWSYAVDFPRLEGELVEGGGAPPRESALHYDELGRVVTSEVATGGRSTLTTRAEFDAFGTPGVLERATDGAPESAYVQSTDLNGRLVGVLATHESVVLGTVTYGYTAAGRPEVVSTSWAGGVGYTYDAGTGLVESVWDETFTTRHARVTHRDAMGRPTRLTTGASGVLTWTWDGNGRVATWSATDGSANETRSWSYDDRSRPVEVEHDGTGGYWREVRAYGGGSPSWGEEPGWLVEELRVDGTGTVTDARSYDYDVGGNRVRTSEWGTPVHEWTYDGSFLETSDGVGVTWSLDELTLDGRGTTITPSADGTEGRVATGTTSYGIGRDPWGRPAWTDDGSAVREQVWGNPGAPSWPLAGVDETGASTLTVALDGMVVGVVTDGGLEVLPGTGGYQLAQHRLYDGTSGRFTRTDPLGLAGGRHRFTYAENDPTRLWDPSGLSASACGGGELSIQPESFTDMIPAERASWGHVGEVPLVEAREAAQAGIDATAGAWLDRVKEDVRGQLGVPPISDPPDPSVPGGPARDGLDAMRRWAPGVDAAGGDDEPDAEEGVANRKPWGLHMVKGLSTWAVARSGPSFWERVEDGFRDLLGSLHGGGRHLALAWAEGQEVLRRLGSSEALYRVRQFANGFGRQLGANVYVAGDPLGYASTFPGHDASHQDASYQAGQVTADLVSMALVGPEMLAREGIAGVGVITTGAAAGGVVTLTLTPATVGGVVVGCAVAAHGVSTAAAGGAHLYTMAASALKGGTYKLVDPETGQVMRAGRSKNLDTTKGQHARDPAHKDLDFEVDRRTDDYAQQPGREQVIHDAYDPPLDEVEPISPTHPRRAEYLDAAKDVE